MITGEEPEIQYREDDGKAKDISIICTCFNHEKYVRQALDSFLNQDTEYSFEIVVHDDASTDGTQAIIKEYQERFPDLITAILQQENQYSKGHFKAFIYTSQFASAKTLMFCDGDDYWLSNTKIQKQYTNFIAYPSIHMAFHPARELINDQLSRRLCMYSEDKHVFSPTQVIMGTGGFCPTGSLMLDKSVVMSMPEALIEVMPIADAFVQAWASREGGAIYTPDVDCVYRINSSSSMTLSINSAEASKKKEFMRRMSKAYRLAAVHSPFRVKYALYKMHRKYLRKARRIKENGCVAS